MNIDYNLKSLKVQGVISKIPSEYCKYNRIVNIIQKVV